MRFICLLACVCVFVLREPRAKKSTSDKVVALCCGGRVAALEKAKECPVDDEEGAGSRNVSLFYFTASPTGMKSRETNVTQRRCLILSSKRYHRCRVHYVQRRYYSLAHTLCNIIPLKHINTLAVSPALTWPARPSTLNSTRRTVHHLAIKIVATLFPFHPVWSYSTLAPHNQILLTYNFMVFREVDNHQLVVRNTPSRVEVVAFDGVQSAQPLSG